MKDIHEDILIWKCFPNNWPFVREIQKSPVDSPYKGPVMQTFVYTIYQVSKTKLLPVISWLSWLENAFGESFTKGQ